MPKDKSSKKLIIIAVATIALVFTGYLFLTQNKADNHAGKTVVINEGSPSAKSITFGKPKQSVHYQGNVPAHGAVLAGVPVNVVIDFNFDIAIKSNISIKQGGREYGTGETIIDSGNLTMREKMDPASPDGLYDVFYRACWADGSCHDGNFQFAIGKAMAEKFSDQRGKPEVTIALENFKFDPREIRVSRGTKITWVNKDGAVHTVNTDNHPGHTYYLAQNSRDLKQRETYSVTFDEPGIYPYHCTPHAKIMTGIILVE